ncbi:MAG: hypothetical protein IT454_04225 [Planctomycetes bacterium]|nr:hypothetical protein [Planctomycetota bacterium]
MTQRSSRFVCAVLAGLFAGACGGGGESAAGRFQIVGVNVNDGATWQLNRALEIEFNAPVDPSSLTLSSINVRHVGGGPVVGEFSLRDGGRRVVFQPRCPSNDDLSDAGLLAGLSPQGSAYQYELNVLGRSGSISTAVTSAEGDVLRSSLTRRFHTPLSSDPRELFLDARPGGPMPLVRNEGESVEAASYVELGATQRVYFERRADGTIALASAEALPLNKLSDPASHVAFVLHFDQPIDPRTDNLAADRLRVEYEDHAGVWQPLTARAKLVANCSDTGAIVRLEPRGVLPPETRLRCVVTSAFLDLVGQHLPVDINGFANASTADFPASGTLDDQWLEDFSSAAALDVLSGQSEPRATCSDGRLSAKFSFGGTGGPGGHFDWLIQSGEVVVLNTASGTVSGGVIFGSGDDVDIIETGTVAISAGVVDVEDFFIESGATLKLEGPHPFTLFASGSVTILGTVVASGSSSSGVNSVGTTNLSEPGASGQLGGGRGGAGHPVTSPGSVRGDSGDGPFGQLDTGGEGGESCWSYTAVVNARRGAGGGGGRLGRDVPSSNPGSLGAFDQTRIGLDAEPGFANVAGANGALSGPAGPFGGAVGAAPFADPDPDNDFFGAMFDALSGRTVVGELTKPWAGSGGGGGGDGVQLQNGGTFPGPFVLGNYQKGAGGGGGGGSVHVLALGNIRFGPQGKLLARGGSGGGGENVWGGVNRVGGGSGGGSGGHVVLESAAKIDFRAVAANSVAIQATGGQGGAGAGDIGGAQLTPSGIKETLPHQDACPSGYPNSGANACRGPLDGAGGDGGPGIVQLHTSTGVFGSSPASADILLPLGVQIQQVCAPPPLCAPSSGPATCAMIPSFGRTSRARSQWIGLGLGAFDVHSPNLRDIEFDLEGLDAGTGRVLTDATGRVLAGVTLWGPLPLPSATAWLRADGRTLELDLSAGLGTPAQVYLDNPNLLVHSAIELEASGARERFDVVAAAFDAGTSILALSVDGDGPPLNGFAGGAPSTARLLWMPFRVTTAGQRDHLPDTASVSVRWQTTRADLAGAPDLAAAGSFSADASVLNTGGNGDQRFVRFEVLFDIDALGQGLSATSPIPALEFLRLPFRW